MTKQIMIICIALLLIGIAMAAENDTTCAEDSCPFNQTTEPSYTYEENLKDSKCFYNLNFCNAGYNVSNINDNAQTVIDLLKQVNYQMQDDLTSYQETIKIKNYFVTFVSILFLFVVIWNIYLMRRKNE